MKKAKALLWVAGLCTCAATAAIANPYLPAGLYGLPTDSLGSFASIIDSFSNTGAHSHPYVGRIEQYSEDGSGTNGPSQAGYGFAVSYQKNNWQSSATDGEIDGINIFGRQGTGDTAAILSNIGAINGFAAGYEGATLGFNSSGSSINTEVDTQMGVVNSRNGGAFGFIANATAGSAIGTGFRANTTGGTWSNAFENIVNGTTNFSVQASTGGITAGTLLPDSNYGANLGLPTQRYNLGYLGRINLNNLLVASNNSAAISAGAVAGDVYRTSTGQLMVVY